jgi:hypothetical protein
VVALATAWCASPMAVAVARTLGVGLGGGPNNSVLRVNDLGPVTGGQVTGPIHWRASGERSQLERRRVSCRHTVRTPIGPPPTSPRWRADLTLVVVLGELVQTTAGKWITHPPTRCPYGHTSRRGRLGPTGLGRPLRKGRTGRWTESVGPLRGRVVKNAVKVRVGDGLGPKVCAVKVRAAEICTV